MVWPNFFIVGAPRSGTTSLYEYLKRVPEIHMSPVKEPNYFSLSLDLNFLLTTPIREEVNYLKLFKNAKNKKAIGEASSNYLWDVKAPELISKTIPKAKIIIILRNPIERAYSHYLMHISNGSENRSFKEVIQEAQKPTTNDYVRRVIEAGFYNKQILNYQKFFPKKQIKIFFFQDFKENTEQVIKDILGFLEINSSIPNNLETKYNQYSVPRGKFSSSVLSNKMIKNIGKNLLSESIGTYFIKKIFNKKVSKPNLDATEKSVLEKIYKNDSQSLQKTLGQRIEWDFL